MFRHFHANLNAQVLATENVDEATDRFDEVIEDNLMTIFWGEAGLGKTSTIRYLAEGSSRELVWLETPADPSPAWVTRAVLQALTGVRHTGRLYNMAQELTELLTLRRPIVVFDEAQRLRLRAIECLRGYWDSVDGGFPLLFIGGDAARKTIQRHQMVLSRLRLDYRFRPLHEAEVVELMPHYHPLYKHTERDLIARVDRDFAHGNLRSWAQFTFTAQKLAAKHARKTLDVDLTHDIYLRHNAPKAAAQLAKDWR